MRSPFRALAAATAAMGVFLAASGCAGASGRIVATGVEQPVSFTPSVYTPSGAVFTAGPQDVLGHVSFGRHNWAMFWRALDLGDTTWDLGPELREAIAQYDGDAVVNLTVTAKSDPFIWYFGYLVPIIPDYVHMVAEADVVRVPGVRGGQ